MGQLDGKIVIVTGATSGMGKAVAELFAAEGASIVACARDDDRGRDLVDSIERRGGKIHFVSGDVSTIDTNRRLVDIAQDVFGGVDILVPNAGMLGLGSITELPPETWRQTVATNLDAVYYLLHLGIPALDKRGGGSIVITGSIAAFKGFPNHAAYCASKGALVALVKQVALDYGPTIRCNLICPGPVDTPLIHSSAAAFPDPVGIVQETAEGVPLKRLGLPNDIARAALFLASSDASWITGSALVIDGGAMCGG